MPTVTICETCPRELPTGIKPCAGCSNAYIAFDTVRETLPGQTRILNNYSEQTARLSQGPEVAIIAQVAGGVLFTGADVPRS